MARAFVHLNWGVHIRIRCDIWPLSHGTQIARVMRIICAWSRDGSPWTWLQKGADYTRCNVSLNSNNNSNELWQQKMQQWRFHTTHVDPTNGTYWFWACVSPELLCGSKIRTDLWHTVSRSCASLSCELASMRSTLCLWNSKMALADCQAERACASSAGSGEGRESTARPAMLDRDVMASGLGQGLDTGIQCSVRQASIGVQTEARSEVRTGNGKLDERYGAKIRGKFGQKLPCWRQCGLILGNGCICFLKTIDIQ